MMSDHSAVAKDGEEILLLKSALTPDVTEMRGHGKGAVH